MATTTNISPGDDKQLDAVVTRASADFDKDATHLGASLANEHEHAMTLGQALKLWPRATMWSIALSFVVIMDGA